MALESTRTAKAREEARGRNHAILRRGTGRRLFSALPLAALLSCGAAAQGAEPPPPAQTSAAALEGARAWLVAHQDEDGRWDADEFMKHDSAGQRCDGAGLKHHDVGVTGLALLALLDDGPRAGEGINDDAIERGLAWLQAVQDHDTGRLGDASAYGFMYDHAIATYALCEHDLRAPDETRRPAIQSAVNFVLRARNPYGAWRYDAPPIGDNDTSVTGWCTLALLAARAGGYSIDEAALEGALAWIDQVTDPATGRCGYDTFGSFSSRTPTNEDFPRDTAEAMTAVALRMRLSLGQRPDTNPITVKHANLLAKHLPLRDAEGKRCDMYYWYHGSRAMREMGGAHWEQWHEALLAALLDSQSEDGPAAGSWDPVGPWGYAGGRVYSTALLALCLM